MKELNDELLRVLYFPGNYPAKEHKTEFRSAFQLWNSIWHDFMAALPEPEALISDHFTRQDEVSALFYGAECVGLVLHRWIDFSLIDFSSDSYFSAWNDMDIARLTARGPLIFLPSYLSVHADFRRNRCQTDLRRLLLCLMNRRFLNSAASAMASTTRNTKNMNQGCYELGAEAIRKNVSFYHEKDPVDLVVTFRDKVNFPEDGKFKLLFERVWDSRVFVAREDHQRFGAKIGKAA